MLTLTKSVDSFDQDNTFTIERKGMHGNVKMRASLHQDYEKQGDGIFWALQSGACLKSSYTQKDIEETSRLNNMQALKHGDIVIIEGEQYKIRVLGNFSNCAIFDKV